MVDKVNLIKRTWVLKKEETHSPWRTKIVPIFLSFQDSSKAIVRGYGSTSEVVYSYLLQNNTLRIGEKMNFQIESITDLILVLNIGGDNYTYFSLPSSNYSVNPVELLKIIAGKGRWRLKGNLIDFTLEEINLTTEKTYKAIEYRNGQKFFGTYFLDEYMGNVFLILLIDGKHREEMFRVLSFTPQTVQLTEIDYGRSVIIMTSAKK
jgi:hypothetical protein